MRKFTMMTAALATAGLFAFSTSSAEARSSWSIGFSSGGYYPRPAYYHPAPIYVAPAPVFYAPRPYYRRPCGYGYPGSFSFSYHHR